jgi:hypothetical protein
MLSLQPSFCNARANLFAVDFVFELREKTWNQALKSEFQKLLKACRVTPKGYPRASTKTDCPMFRARMYCSSRRRSF